MKELPGRLVLLGHPVAHSLSPRFQNAALRHCGIPLTYEAMDVAPEELPVVLLELARANAAGNVTIPHKEAMAEACAILTPIARRVGAVNTFWHEGGALFGDNTDVGGFEAAVRQLLGALPTGTTVGVIGAGGAAAAVLAAVERWHGSRALVANRTPARGARLRARFSSIAQQADVGRIAAEAQLVVNATSIGLLDDAVPLPVDAIRPGASVIDLVYRAGETQWVRGARSTGHNAMDGLPMLIEQGALAFERWCGCQAPRELMRSAVD